MHNLQRLVGLIRQNLEKVRSFKPDPKADLDEVEADQALLAMATQLRKLDNELGLNEALLEEGFPPLGFVIQANGEREDLYFRDMTNKIMHASRYEWRVGDGLVVTCISEDKDRWQSAEIDVATLDGLCDRASLAVL